MSSDTNYSDLNLYDITEQRHVSEKTALKDYGYAKLQGQYPISQGYDIVGGEVTLYLNGSSLGNLSTTGNLSLGSLVCIDFDESDYSSSGTNTLEFVNNGGDAIWGIRIRSFSIMNPIPPAIMLLLDE